MMLGEDEGDEGEGTFGVSLCGQGCRSLWQGRCLISCLLF